MTLLKRSNVPSNPSNVTNQSARYSEYPNVLLFSSYVSYESGASHALRETVKRIRARGIRPLVVLPKAQDSRAMFPKEDFDVAYLNIQRPRRTWNALTHARYLLSLPKTLLSIRRLILERGIHLVHFNEITDFIAGIAAKWCGVPCICHVRADRPPNPYRWLLLATLSRTTNAIVVPSKSAGDWIASDRRELAGRIKLIHDYAFDARDYQPSLPGPVFRRELGLPDDHVLVLLVSKLVVQKGHKCFIRAAEKVLRVSRKISFIIVGGVVPGHEDEAFAIKALAEKLVPPPALRFVGSRSDLPSVYSGSDIVVHCPIFPDTYPTVVLLPMLMGKPVVGSNIGGIPEQIEHEKTGILVPPDDPDALANAILQLATDPAKRHAVGTAAMEKIQVASAPGTQARLLTELYAETMTKDIRRRDDGLHSSRTQEDPLSKGST
jgi:glycosyltransferase involved in cell wall biosynthesis